jgi:hypothetical protein
MPARLHGKDITVKEKTKREMDGKKRHWMRRLHFSCNKYALSNIHPSNLNELTWLMAMFACVLKVKTRSTPSSQEHNSCTFTPALPWGYIFLPVGPV